MATPPNLKLKSKLVPVLSVPTNQLLVEFPADWSKLLQHYTLWRYRLSEHQENHKKFADRYFYERFTNAYKNQFDQPFYFYTFDTPAAALYTLAPHGHHPEPWLYPFGTKAQPEEICGEIVAPDEVRPHILLKLLVALCFYEASPNDQERRVCQSKFYLRVKGKSGNNFLTVVEVKPTVEQEKTSPYPLTLTVEANFFARARSAEDRTNTALGAYYELFDSQGHTYFRQLRPSQVATFEGDLYQRKVLSKRAQADWHNDGDKVNADKYKESRSYLVYHVQKRLIEFLDRYNFRAEAAEEPMERQLNRKELLPLQRFTSIQVVDNRLNKQDIGIGQYLDWLASYSFPTSDGAMTLPFEL